LDGRKLALLTYVSRYGSEQVFSAGSLHRDFPFIKHLFSGDSRDLEEILERLKEGAYLVTQDDRLKTYTRSARLERGAIWPTVYKRLIDTDRSFVRDRTPLILRDIRLSDCLELEKSCGDGNLTDPFLSAFSGDLRVGQAGWWKRVCTLANLYDGVEQHDTISRLSFEFMETTKLELATKIDKDVFLQEIDQIWQETGIVELSAVVDNITPWKSFAPIQLMLVQWRDISFEKRDEIRSKALKALLENATIAHMILPVGDPNERDEETLRSTQLVIFTPEDTKEIFIDKRPGIRFREMLRERMDIELLSPYQITSFVPETMFFGREYQIRLIASHPGTNYAVYGGRRSGKSSLLRHLQRFYQEKRSLVFIDCELVSCEGDFLSLLCQSLKMETAGSYSEFLATEKHIEPDTLLLIDEVDHALSACDPQRIIGMLRYLNEQFSARCILSGATDLYKQFRDIKTPMYNFADPLLLGPFTELEAIALAKEPMLSLDVAYEKGNSTIKQLINLCGRFPNLIQSLCHDLVIELKRQQVRVIKSDMLNEVFEGDAFGYYFEQHFHHNFNPYQKLIVYCALMVTSMPLKTIVEKVQEHYKLSMNKIEDLLEELVMLFVFEKTATTYKWIYEGFPKLLRRRIKNPEFRIKQIIDEIEGKTKNE